MVSIRPDEISAILKQQIEDYDKSVSVSNVGSVLQVGDGIARVYGLQEVIAICFKAHTHCLLNAISYM